MDYRKTMLRFMEASFQINAAYNLLAQKYNIQLNTLKTFYILDEYENVTQKIISDKLQLPKSTVHSICLVLQKKGFISIEKGKNRKEKYIVFTDKGNIFFADIKKDTEIFESQTLANFGEDNFLRYIDQMEILSKELYIQALKVEGRQL